MKDSIKRLLKKHLVGSKYGQEYLCLPLNCPDQLTVELARGESHKRFPVGQHLFLGYAPLILGFTFFQEDNVSEQLESSDSAYVYFMYKGNQVGKMKLGRVAVRKFETSSLFIYRGISAHHRLLPFWQRLVNNTLERFRSKAPGNINLIGNLYTQVRLAYAIPRKISLITLAANGLMNVFPTDLHGAIDSEHYVGSLRIAGEACQQVDEIGKVLLATMPLSAYKEVYALGKNHMKPLGPKNDYDWAEVNSEMLSFPIPIKAMAYMELEKTDAIDIGAHRLQFYKIINTVDVKDDETVLAHIHCYYAAWRDRHHLPNDILVR